MKKINPIMYAFIIMIAFCSCNDDDDDVTYPDFIPPSSQAFTALRTIAQNNLKQEFNFDAAAGPVTFTSQNGVTISLNSLCLTKNSQPVTGQVKLEFKEVYKRGNMLTANTPTMGNMGNGDLSLLLSGGEFYINATQNGDQLEYNCNYQLTIPGALTGGTDNTMTLWDGTFNGDNLIWNENEGGQENGVFAEGGNYNLFNDEFGWTNVDRFYSDPRPKTTLSVQVPVGYNSTNCSVYLSYVGEPSALAFLDTYDAVTGTFSEHYGQIPIGLECHVIFVSEMAGQWVYAIEDETIEANEVIDIDEEDLYVTSEANLITLINNLP
jgi:hypothetical protein